MPVTLRAEHLDGVAVLTLERPDRLNAIGSDTVRDLHRHLDAIESNGTTDANRTAGANGTTRAIVITGAGRAFSAGADITELDGLRDGTDFARFVKGLTDVFDRLAASPIPSIAAINGIAFGGGLELALACDLRVVHPNARLGVPEVKLGLLPAAGGSQRLARMLPAAVAKHLLFTGAHLAPEDALRYGLVNQLSEDVMSSAMELARTLAAGPPRALAAAKHLVDVGGELPIAAGIELERARVSELFDTADRVEGISAFLAKRAPHFTGQ